MTKITKLRSLLEEVYHLEAIFSLLSWDKATYMPKAAAASRGNQMAVLAKVIKEKLTDDNLIALIEELSKEKEEGFLEEQDYFLLRVAKRRIDEARRIPSSFLESFYKHLLKTYEKFLYARQENNFEIVLPYLKTTLDFSKEYASFFPYEHILDPLINRSDYNLKASFLKSFFLALKEQLLPFMQEILEMKGFDTSFLFQYFPKRRQLSFAKYIIKRLGFDFQRCRLDLSCHPFMTKFAHKDIRITTRVNEKDFCDALFSSIHETGHALYEMGIDEEFEGTFLNTGISSSIHESQSRLWENVVGRSIYFWQYFYPKLQDFFPVQFKNVTLEDFYKAINNVKRSLIRTEADELTYNFHVIIRFELELGLLEGSILIEDLKEAWNEKYRKYLAIAPLNDKEGILQDIHWYIDYIGGSFQGYTLGNILSVQFYEAAKKEYYSIEEDICKGDFRKLHKWLKDNLYIHGNKYTTEEIVQKATGKKFVLEPYLNYLKNKYSNIYFKEGSILNG